MTGSLEASDAAAAAVQKTPNRVTLDSMKEAVDAVNYFNPPSAPHMTLALVHFKNGYLQVGQSAPADPANFNAELGQKFAYEDALRKSWPLFGFALCEKLAQQ